METIGKQKKYLIDSPIPTQLEILSRMERRFGNVSKVLQDILSPCSEEAERIMFELLISTSDRKPIVIRTTRLRGSRHIRRKRETGYHCTSCKYPSIRLDSKFCPGCGKPIEWI